MKYLAKKKGFTLIEVLVVAGIFTLIIGVSLTLVSSGRLSVDITDAQIEAEENARNAMNKITKELRLSSPSHVHFSNAVGWTTNNNSGSVVNFQIPVGSYEVSLLPYLTANYEIRWGCALHEGVHLAYSIDGNSQLLRSAYSLADGSDATNGIIAQHITSLSFSRISASSEYITVIIASQAQTTSGDTITRTLQSSIKLRN